MSAPISAAELQKALGISRRAVSRYVKAGCPHARGEHSNSPLVFELDAVKRWMRSTTKGGQYGRPPAGEEQAPAPTRARVVARLGVEGARPPHWKSDDDEEGLDDGGLLELARRVNIEIKRLEVTKRTRLEAEASGELVALDEVRRAWLAQIEIVQARVRAFPALVAPRLVGLEYDAIRGILEGEMHDMLASFSKDELL